MSVSGPTVALLIVLTPAAFVAPCIATQAAEQQGSLFQRLDKNEDGLIDRGEIELPQEQAFERLLRVGDQNNDGQITESEFRLATSDAPLPDLQPEQPQMRFFSPATSSLPVQRVLEALDRNRDAKLTTIEMELAPQRLLALDRNRNGVIEAEELSGE